MLVYRASKEIVDCPEIRKTKFTKDFSWGFYCTNNFKQAVRWANRGEGVPRINYFEYEPTSNLNILKFEKMTDEWLDLLLSHAPERCLDSIILHELLHLKVRHHNKDFTALMDKYMPYWEDVRKELNDFILLPLKK